MQIPHTDFVSLNLCRTTAVHGQEWQASLERTRGAFSIRHGATPHEAIAALFEAVPSDIPPPPPY